MITELVRHDLASPGFYAYQGRYFLWTSMLYDARADGNLPPAASKAPHSTEVVCTQA